MRLLLDEDFNNDILRGLIRKKPDIDIVRVQDIPEIASRNDNQVLAWAAQENRVLFTHDANTMTSQAIARIDAGLPMPGIFVVSQFLSIGKVIEDMLLLIEDSHIGEWDNLVIFLPLK